MEGIMQKNSCEHGRTNKKIEPAHWSRSIFLRHLAYFEIRSMYIRQKGCRDLPSLKQVKMLPGFSFCSFFLR